MCIVNIKKAFDNGIGKCVTKESPNKDKFGGIQPGNFINCKDGVQSDMPIKDAPTE